ncbi:MAG: hypothetical protein ABIP74_00980 [Candidatus Saccharimonas sp.]
MDGQSDDERERFLNQLIAVAFGLLAISSIQQLEREMPIPSVTTTRYLVLSIIEYVRYRSLSERQ